MSAICYTCEWQPAKVKGECRTCYLYRYRHGVERPEHLIVEHGRRLSEGMKR